AVHFSHLHFPLLLLKLCIAPGILAGLSIMSKGPVSVYALLLPFIVANACCMRPSVRGKSVAIAVMIALALCVGLWWYAYVRMSVPEALDCVVAKESSSWLKHNVRPWYYYWKFFLEAGVWSLLLVISIVLPMLDKRRRHSRRWLFSLIWMTGTLVLLSLLPEKKSRYLLPLLIPASYLMGCMLLWWKSAFSGLNSATVPDKVCLRTNALLIALCTLALPIAAWTCMYANGHLSTAGMIFVTMICIIVAAALVLSAISLSPVNMLYAVVTLFVFAECYAMPSIGKAITNNERKSIAETRKHTELNGIPFYYVEQEPLRIEMVYAAHRTIKPIDAMQKDTLMARLPCVLLTHKPVGETLPHAFFNDIDTVTIGKYDDNRYPKGSRRYGTAFIYHVTLLKIKKRNDGNDEKTDSISKRKFKRIRLHEQRNKMACLYI
ncbi:MAG: hypothetical protein Q4D41_09225, partial [Prevotellaceae bacterium]|nr:hypothetical protein [Prevotellaceae bacterium]